MRSVKLGLVAAAMLMGTTALTTPAFATGNNNGATQDHTCQGGNNCNTGGTGGVDVDVNVDIDNYNTSYGGKGGTAYGGKVENDIDNYNDSHNTAYGGKGGTGYGGDAKAYGGDAKAYGGDAKAYGGKVENENYNDSHNTAYGGKVENENYNDSHNTAYGGKGGDAKAYGGKGGDAKAYGGSVKDSGNSYNDNDNRSNAEVNITENNPRAPVNTAYAAGLSVGEDTCMGSSSIGAQAVSFGLSIGTTWQDDNCRRLKNSRQLVALGYHRAATSLMCVDDDVRQAMIMAGTPCPNGEVVAVVAAPPAREYVPMAPVADDRPHKRRHRVRKPLPPK
jgi:hypothetical protein